MIACYLTSAAGGDVQSWEDVMSREHVYTYMHKIKATSAWMVVHRHKCIERM